MANRVHVYLHSHSHGCLLVSHSVCPTLCDPMDNPWNSPGKNTGVDSLIPSPGDLPNPGIEPESVAWQAGSLLFEPPKKWDLNTHLQGSL